MGMAFLLIWTGGLRHLGTVVMMIGDGVVLKETDRGIQIRGTTLQAEVEVEEGGIGEVDISGTIVIRLVMIDARGSDLDHQSMLAEVVVADGIEVKTRVVMDGGVREDGEEVEAEEEEVMSKIDPEGFPVPDRIVENLNLLMVVGGLDSLVLRQIIGIRAGDDSLLNQGKMSLVGIYHPRRIPRMEMGISVTITLT